MESTAIPHCANNDYNLLLHTEETCFEDSKPAVASHSACQSPNPFEYTLKSTLVEQSASKSSKTTKKPSSAPLEGLDVASHPSGEGAGARGSNSNPSTTKKLFLRKSRSTVGLKGFRSTPIENSDPSRDHLFSTSGPAFPNSPPSTIRPSAAATQATNLAATDDHRLEKQTLMVPESVLDRLLKATRPCSPCNPKSVLERLKSKYTLLRGTVGVEKPREQVYNDPLPGSTSTDLRTSADAHPRVDEGIPPEAFLDLFGNVPSAKAYAAYLSIAVELASPSPSHHSLLSPPPVIYEGRDGMKPFAQYKARPTYEDRYLPPPASAISLPDDSRERRNAVEAGDRAATSIDALSSTKGSTATQGRSSGPLLLNSGQAHLDSLGSPRHETAACHPPDMSPGRTAFDDMRFDIGAPVRTSGVLHGDALPPPTSHSFEGEGLGSQSDYDSFFFPSLPARKGTPPPENFGKGTEVAPSFTGPRAHSSPPHGREEYDDMITKFSRRTAMFSDDLVYSDWRSRSPSETGQWQPQKSCSSSESSLVYTGGAIYGSSPYASVYFEYGSPAKKLQRREVWAQSRMK